jgi:hypothetical protein
MYKQIIKAVPVLALILMMMSCEEFLQEEPKNQISTNQYFNKPEHARSAVNALYGMGAPSRYNDGDDWQLDMMLGGYLSGLFVNERTERPGPYEANRLTLDDVNLDAYMHEWWSEGYDAVSQANNAIKYIPQIEGLSESETNRLLAEARFFRAFNYFFLVRNFGDVPLITEPYESAENLYVERTPSSQVYQQIVTDLEWALNNGGLASVPFHMNGNRITTGIVQTALADAYLQQAGYPVEGGETSYASAATYAREVIQSGEYALIEHGDLDDTLANSAYNVMRTSNQEREYIYSYECHPQHRSNWLYHSSIPKYAQPAESVTRDVWIAYRPKKEYTRVYNDEMDLRIQNKQIWHNKITYNGEEYGFQGNWAPYIWYDEQALFETDRSGKNVRIYRYAEVLLIAAEALARTEGVTNEAVSYLADVRNRAYWQTDRNQIESELQGLSEEEFVQEVWKERLRELPLQFKIWPDIQRTRMYPVTDVDNPGEVTFENVVGHDNTFGENFEEHHLLYPLPKRAKDRNPELTGNGY